MVHHLLGSDLVAAVEVLVRVFWMVVKEVLVDEGEMAFAAVVVKEIVSVVPLSAFCALLMALRRSIVVS